MYRLWKGSRVTVLSKIKNLTFDINVCLNYKESIPILPMVINYY